MLLNLNKCYFKPDLLRFIICYDIANWSVYKISNEDVPLLNTTGQFWLRAWKLITIRTWFLNESNYTCVGISQNMTKVAALSCVAIMVIDLSISWLKWLNYNTKYTLSKFQVIHPWSSAMHAMLSSSHLEALEVEIILEITSKVEMNTSH